MLDDSELLRRFEPVLKFTRGEIFFPMDVEDYVHASSLWVQRPNQDPECLVPQGGLNLDVLAQPLSGRPGEIYYLRFIEPPDILKLINYIRQRRKNEKPQDRFHAGLGRLARVGYSSRFADLLLTFSLLLRGRVPGDASASASLEYQRILAETNRYAYYGRVLRQGGWIILQYWFFYAFNNWRSGFFGVNDHEADWESINIFLYEPAPDVYQPEWVAYAAHEYSGDDLRRRFDDPELQKIGEHPGVFVGAGSHASYYSPGEYLAEIELPFLSPIAAWVKNISKPFRRFLGSRDGAQPLPASSAAQEELALEEADRPTHVQDHHHNVLRAPFVDYARGDGVVIGLGGDHTWDAPRLLSPQPPGWVSNFPGLWGLYARDPISGEDAPAGPMYNRNGTIRRSWYDPVGWAGMDKVPPPHQALQRLHEEQHLLEKELFNLSEEINDKSGQLIRLGVTNAALQSSLEWLALQAEQRAHIEAASHELDQLRARYAVDHKRLEALQRYQQRLVEGEKDPPRAHIRRAHQPASLSEMRINRLVELWAALSMGLLMIGFVALALFYRQHLILGLVVLVSIFTFIESGFRRQLDQLINSIAIGLAVVCALLILFHFFWWVVVLTVLIAGVYILWDNLRELVG